MTAKEDFEKAFAEKTGLSAQGFHQSRDFRRFSRELDRHPELKSMFRMAVLENPTPDM